MFPGGGEGLRIAGFSRSVIFPLISSSIDTASIKVHNAEILFL